MDSFRRDDGVLLAGLILEGESTKEVITRPVKKVFPGERDLWGWFTVKGRRSRPVYSKFEKSCNH